MKPLLPALLVCIFSLTAQAEQKQQLGNWDVHYIAFPAPLLTVEIARQYQLQRSKYNAVVNVSVLDSNTQQAQKVAISGNAKDLLGRQRTLEGKGQRRFLQPHFSQYQRRTSGHRQGKEENRHRNRCSHDRIDRQAVQPLWLPLGL